MSSEKVPEKNSNSDFEPPWFFAAEESSLKEGNLLRVQPGGRNVYSLRLKAKFMLSQISALMRNALWTGARLKNLY